MIMTSYTPEELKSIFRDCIGELQTINPPPSLPITEEFLTEKEVSKEFQISKVSLKKFRDQKLINFYKIGSRIRYKRSELLASFQDRKKYGRDAK